MLRASLAQCTVGARRVVQTRSRYCTTKSGLAATVSVLMLWGVLRLRVIRNKRGGWRQWPWQHVLPWRVNCSRRLETYLPFRNPVVERRRFRGQVCFKDGFRRINEQTSPINCFLVLPFLLPACFRQFRGPTPHIHANYFRKKQSYSTLGLLFSYLVKLLKVARKPVFRPLSFSRTNLSAVADWISQ